MSTALQPQLKHKEVEITGEHVQQFMAFVTEGVLAWTKAGRLLVQMVERNPNTFALIRKDNPQLSIDVLLAFEKIGRNEIYPYLLLEDSPGSKRLLALPYELQTKYYKTKVKVAVGWLAGKPVVEEKDVHALTSKEAERAFSPKGLRPIEEQIQLLPSPPSSRAGTCGNIGGRVKPKLVSLGCFRFVPDKVGNPVLQKVDRESLISPLRLEILPDARGAMGCDPFEVFRPELPSEQLPDGDAPAKTRTLDTIIQERIDALQESITDKEESRHGVANGSPQAKAIDRDLTRLRKELEQQKLLAS